MEMKTVKEENCGLTPILAGFPLENTPLLKIPSAPQPGKRSLLGRSLDLRRLTPDFASLRQTAMGWHLNRLLTHLLYALYALLSLFHSPFHIPFCPFPS